MTELAQRLKALSSANEFLAFFGIAYDERVVNVNRLHILKRFYQYLHRSEGLEQLDDVELFRRYRELLLQAYTDFTVSDARTEKVFKVFQDADGRQHVAASSLRETLAEYRRRTVAPPRAAFASPEGSAVLEAAQRTA